MGATFCKNCKWGRHGICHHKRLWWIDCIDENGNREFYKRKWWKFWVNK